jgi:glycosyltransferase involved in cell wall biosynthesis
MRKPIEEPAMIMAVRKPVELPPPPPGKTGWPWSLEDQIHSVTMPDGDRLPRISIVTPSFNQGQYIEETIRSVLLQGYPDLEYIIIDGGSTDQSVEIIQKYEPWLSYWVSEPDDGQSDAINKGFGRSTGRILNWLNSDDALEKNALGKIGIAATAARTDAGAFVGMGSFIDTNGQAVRCNFPSEISRETLLRWTIDDVWFLQPACFVTKEAWDLCGPLSLDLHYSMDLAFYIKIAQHFRFEFVSELIAYAHRHPDAKTVGKWLYGKGEVALLFATLPDGFQAATAVIKDLIDRDLAEHVKREMASQSPLDAFRKNDTVRRFTRHLRLGYLRRFVRRGTAAGFSNRTLPLP